MLGRATSWYVISAIFLMVACIGFVNLGANLYKRAGPDVVEASRFVVKRPNGSVAAEFGVSETGETRLVIRTVDGKDAAILEQGDDGVILSLADGKGRARIGVMVPAVDEAPAALPSITFTDANGIPVDSINPEGTRHMRGNRATGNR
jgi:hypothetical protein